MARLPPQPSPAHPTLHVLRGLWPLWTVLVLVFLFIFVTWATILTNADESLAVDDWLAFVGSLSGGAVGGLAAIGVFLLTVRAENNRQEKVRAAEREQQRQDLRAKVGAELEQSLSTLFAPSAVGSTGPQMEHQARQIEWQAALLSRGWAEDHYARVPVHALMRLSTIAVQAVGKQPNDDHDDELRSLTEDIYPLARVLAAALVAGRDDEVFIRAWKLTEKLNELWPPEQPHPI